MIPFNDLKPSHTLLAEEINAAVLRSVSSGWYILGPEVEAFEAELAAYHGVKHAIGVANGTDAIELALRAGGIGSGDEVITVSHTAVPTVCAIDETGATPVLVDIDSKNYTMDPSAARAAITPHTRAIVPVHLYGHPAAMKDLIDICDTLGLLLVEDCAQAHGAKVDGKPVGTFGHLAAFSFYPTKNLGAYGDGGAILTNDDQLYARIKRLRNYGQTKRYANLERGVNSRLDEIQAAILRVKLKYLDEHIGIRRQLAALYNTNLSGPVLPEGSSDVMHAYHLYVMRHPQRDQIMAALAEHDIGTLIHYPIAVHQQEAYTDLGYGVGSLPVTEKVVKEILSLPLYVGLTVDQVSTISTAVNEFLGRQ
ncbi:MAG: DegT/DnrJ/EryC1/StrS family aminotransferase [Anaerolineae bacterium]